ncbi:6688_t:CDS:1, partial [Acaulospora morrowiae]
MYSGRLFCNFPRGKLINSNLRWKTNIIAGKNKQVFGQYYSKFYHQSRQIHARTRLANLNRYPLAVSSNFLLSSITLRNSVSSNRRALYDTLSNPNYVGSRTKTISAQSSTKPIVGYWLLGTSGLVFGIVVLGGLTRLTESGLSIVEWKPITGVLPPITNSQWEKEFE